MKGYSLSAIVAIWVLSFGTGYAQDPGERAVSLEEKLQSIQRAIEETGVNWTAGMTEIFKLPPEKRKRFLGSADSVSEEKLPASQLLMRYSWQPETFDWHNKDGSDWMTPIRNQGDCGSCVAFGTIGTFEGQLNVSSHDPDLDMDLSEQHLFNCGDGTCDGGWTSSEAAQYLQENGVPDEDCFPYTSGESGEDQPCENTCPDWHDRALRISCWDWVGGDDGVRTPAEIKEQLLQGPVTTSMTVYDDFQAYTGGIYEHVWGEDPGGHCVCIVGWDDTTEPPCWIVRNSWGSSWGERGYFRIRMGTNEVGIEDRNLFMVAGDAPLGILSDTGYNYGNVEVGYSEHWQMSISNEGAASLHIFGYSSSLPDFSISAPNTFPQTILPGGSLDFTFTFTPIALETRQGRITIESDNCKDLPEIRLRGTGIIRYVRPDPTSIEETLVQGERRTVPLSLTNTRNSTLTFTVTVLREWLSVDPDSGVLEGGGSATLEVTFDASSLAPSEVTTNILIYTDDPEDNVVVVSVRLVVEEAIVTVSTPSTVRFVDPTFDVGIAVDTETRVQKPLAEISMQVGYDAAFLELQTVAPTSRCEIMSDFRWDASESGEVVLSISDATGNTIPPGAGDLVILTFETQEESVCGDTTWLILSEVALMDTMDDSLEVEIEGGILVFLCKGDVNIDGTVNVLDVLAVVNHILNIQLLEASSLSRADCNGDESINILDALGIVNVLLGIGGCVP